MELLIFVVMYLLIGYLVDIWVQKGFKMPSFIMMTIWPLFLIICVIIMSAEKGLKTDIEKVKKIDAYREHEPKKQCVGRACESLCLGDNRREMMCFCVKRNEDGMCPDTCMFYVHECDEDGE